MSNKPNQKHIRNEAGEYQCLCACGKQFWCARFNGKYCSDHCRLQALSNTREARKRYVPPVITNTCEACGIKFVGKRPYLTYITCGAPECRLEIRRRRGKDQTAKAQGQRHSKMNNCLGHGCNAKVLDPLHFCPKCRKYRANYPSYADCWGAVI